MFDDALDIFLNSVERKDVIESRKRFNDLMNVKTDDVLKVLKFEVASNIFKEKEKVQ